jgi:PIN domain nuclease of toxin-antitoxin system
LIILDTHVLLWMDRNDDALGPLARNLIESQWHNDTVAVSAISFWEVAMLQQRQRITLPTIVQKWRAELTQSGLKEISLDGHLALIASELKSFQRDPADRFIAATAMVNDAILVTADTQILGWKGSLKCQDARH